MAYEYLRGRIEESHWLGKSILSINDRVFDFVNAPRDWLKSLPMMQAIADLPPLAFITEMMDKLSDVVPTCALLLLETGYAINRAYNSEKYVGQLIRQGKGLLSNNAGDSRNQGIYLMGVNAQNVLSDCSPYLMELSAFVEDYAPQALLERWQNQALLAITDLMEEIAAQLEAAAKDMQAKLKRQLKKLQRIEGAYGSGQASNVKFISPLVPVMPALPTIAGAASVISGMAQWLLSQVLLAGVSISVPVEALAWAVASMVLKYLGGVGAEACRYLAGGILRGVGNSLPTLIAPTGLFAGCWGLLQAFAPYLILAAVLVIALMKYQTVIGEYLYVFGQAGNTVAYGSAKLYDTNRDEMTAELKALAEEMRKQNFGNFSNLMGFALDEDEEIAMAWNLSRNEPIYGKAAQRQAFEVFRNLYEQGPLGV